VTWSIVVILVVLGIVFVWIGGGFIGRVRGPLARIGPLGDRVTSDDANLDKPRDEGGLL
jgi:hypothetical protein